MTFSGAELPGKGSPLYKMENRTSPEGPTVKWSSYSQTWYVNLVFQKDDLDFFFLVTNW